MFEVTGRRLLIVEDNLDLLDEMAFYFRNKGNVVFTASTLRQATDFFESEKLDAVILDIILPDGEGLTLLENKHTYPPVIILSDLGGDDNITAGLFAGAVDYIVKPCSMLQLEVRLSLRLLPSQDASVSMHGLTLNITERTVKYRDGTVNLTGSEFNILHLLMTHAGHFFTSEEIYEKVWNAPSLQTTTVKRHLSTLRYKLKEVTNKNLIVTEFGKGYCFIAVG